MSKLYNRCVAYCGKNVIIYHYDSPLHTFLYPVSKNLSADTYVIIKPIYLLVNLKNALNKPKILCQFYIDIIYLLCMTKRT